MSDKPFESHRKTPKGRRGAVDHTVYEHSSIIKFVSDNWGLPYLTARHAATNSIEKAFRGFKTFDPDPSYVPYEAPLHLALEPTLESLPASSPPALTEGSDLHVLEAMGWFDKLPVNTDLRFEDSYLRSRPALLADAAASLSKAAV